MNIVLLESGLIRKLLSCESSHTELASTSINCCLIGDAFFEVEKLKKRGHAMAHIRSGASEFQIGVNQNRVFIAPLDSSALQNGLFEENEGIICFHADAVNYEYHPYESLGIITLRDFDLTFGTNYLQTRFAD
jgi:hypothetical protein